MAVVERQREYETIYILRTTADEEAAAKARTRVEGIIEESGGHLIRFDDWGPRKLAYEIRDRTDATYHNNGRYQYYRFLAPTATVAEVERNLRILEPVLKFLTVKLDDNLIPKDRLARKADEDATAAEAAAATAEEE